jgi:hypothetical protein
MELLPARTSALQLVWQPLIHSREGNLSRSFAQRKAKGDKPSRPVTFCLSLRLSMN